MTYQEEARLAALREYEIVGTEPEAEYNQIAQLAAILFDVPIALVSFVEHGRQWLKARVGSVVEETSREVAFCSHTILSDALLVVPNALDDERFAQNPLVQGAPGIRFYAGAPLTMPSGHRLGALCLIDDKPRNPLTPEQERVLQGLAELVVSHLEMRRLQRNQVMARNMAEALADALVVINEHGRITFWNRAASTLFGFSRDEVIGQPAEFILPDEPRRSGVASVLAQLQRGQRPNLPGKPVQISCHRKDGSTFPAELSLGCWGEGSTFGAGAIIRDVSERQASEAILHRLAYYDGLTGAANRTLLRLRLEEALASTGSASLIMVGIDGFKAVNDRVGQDAGDQFLAAVSSRLSGRANNTTLIARLGGDEFGVLISGSADPLSARSMADSIRDDLARPYNAGGRAVNVTASLGIALAPSHATEAGELLTSAGLALHQAKAAGRNSIVMFTPALRGEVTARLNMSEELRRAFEKGEFELHYQPQVRLCDGALVGTEALLRWRHPERGLLSPAAFLPVLEAHVLAPMVGSWVLATACVQAVRWRAVLPNLRMAVNLFAAQFHAGDLVGEVLATLHRSGLSTDALDLEVTENIALQQDNIYLACLRRLHEHGVQIALDDFGTGYASLSMLQRLPLHRLKIDRSFIQGIETARKDKAIVQALLAMSRSLDLTVLAEGIETEGQVEVLMELGCQEGQGYRFGKPMDAAAFTNMLVEGASHFASATTLPASAAL